MSQKEKQIIITMVLILLYLIPILVLYTNHRNKPEVMMVFSPCSASVTSQQPPQTSITSDGG